MDRFVFLFCAIALLATDVRGDDIVPEDQPAIPFNSSLDLRVLGYRNAPFCNFHYDDYFGRTPLPAEETIAIPASVEWYVQPARRGLNGPQFEALCAEIRRQQIPGLTLEAPSLWHYENLISPPYWEHLGTLTHLRLLSLSYITDADAMDVALAGVRCMPELERLDLSGTYHSPDALAHLEPLARLKSLDLSLSTVTDQGISHIVRIPSLTELGLRGCERLTVRSFRSLSELPVLRSLDLSSTTYSPSELCELRHCESLAELDLSKTAANDEVLRALLPLRNLRRLDLGNTQVTDEGIRLLKEFDQLESLSLDGLDLTTQSFSSLSSHLSLRSLSLGECSHVTDATLLALSSLDGLSELNLSGTSITDQGVAHLARLERLEVLGLQGTAITDAGLATVKLLRSLKMLILDGTSIGDAGISNLAAMPELRHLSLNDTAITDAAMSSIASCDKLELLSLANTAIGDPGVEMLADNLRELQVLLLDETEITDGSLRRLSQFKRLWWLGINECVFITDAGVQELANVPDLTLLFVALGNPGITRKGLSDLFLTTQGTINIE